MKKEQDEEGGTCKRTRLQRAVVCIIANKEPFDPPLESIDDSYLLDHLHHLYQDTYDHATYNTWLINRPFPKAFEQFSYCGHSYMIKPSKYMHGVGTSLFILSYVCVHHDIVPSTLIFLCGPIYK